MAHPLGEIALVVPHGRDAADPAQVSALSTALRDRSVDSRVVTVTPEQDVAATIERESRAGVRFAVVCGGLGTFARAATALADAEPPTADVVLGTFPGGRSNDLARTFGLDVSPRAAAVLLASERVMRIDVGVATVTTREGPRRHVVVNEAVVGLGAEVYRRHARLARAARVGPLGAWWAALATYRPRRFDVDMTFAEWHDDAVQVRLANGQFAHDGLHVSPLALPDDGAWDVQVWDGPVHLPFTLQPRMVLGEHLPHPHIAQWRHKRVEVTTARPTAVAVDGSYVGTTPATFEIRPGALRLKI